LFLSNPETTTGIICVFWSLTLAFSRAKQDVKVRNLNEHSMLSYSSTPHELSLALSIVSSIRIANLILEPRFIILLYVR